MHHLRYWLDTGDIIILKWQQKPLHVLMAEGIKNQDEKTILTLIDTTDESKPPGMKRYNITITKDAQDLGIGKQQWDAASVMLNASTMTNKGVKPKDSVSQRFAGAGDEGLSKDDPRTAADYSVLRMKTLTK